jgi:hypothetical protein
MLAVLFAAAVTIAQIAPGVDVKNFTYPKPPCSINGVAPEHVEMRNGYASWANEAAGSGLDFHVSTASSGPMRGDDSVQTAVTIVCDLPSPAFYEVYLVLVELQPGNKPAAIATLSIGSDTTGIPKVRIDGNRLYVEGCSGDETCAKSQIDVYALRGERLVLTSHREYATPKKPPA